MRLTLSGMRGRVGFDFTHEIVQDFTKRYAIWLGEGSKVVVGRDTRLSSSAFSSTIFKTLHSMGIVVFDAGVQPTPVILHFIRHQNYDGGVIVTGSHNPEDQNGIKFIDSSHTFLGNKEIAEIIALSAEQSLFPNISEPENPKQKNSDIFSLYSEHLKQFIEKSKPPQKKLRVVVDPNAGTATGIISPLLTHFGHEVKKVNTEFLNSLHFPRKIEPIAENLRSLQEKILTTSADVGFAFDCDADRVTLVDANGMVFPENISVLFPMYHLLKTNRESPNPKSVIIITNIASSLAFDDIANDFGGELIRTPIGEHYLAKKMSYLQKTHPSALILGGEGSSGGFMYPEFNNARDAIFATCKICEILSTCNESLADLIQEIPKYHTVKGAIPTTKDKIGNLQTRLDSEKIKYTQIGNDVKIIDIEEKEWVLIHPSNTEPVIRIIAEAREKKRASELVKKYRTFLQN